MKKVFKLILFILISMCVISCSKKNPGEKAESEPAIEFQENGLAVLNIQVPLKMEAYNTGFTGDGTFHNAEFIASEMKVGLNLGNTMEAYDADDCEKFSYTWIPIVGSNTPSDYEQRWGSPVITQEMVDGIKAAGFSTVRIPVFWGNMMKNDGKWQINSQYIDRVRQIADYCLKDDLYVVINCHHFDEFIIRRNSIEDCSVIFQNIWTQIASYFANYSEKLVFEGFNEYLGGKQFNEKGYLVNVRQDAAYELTNRMNQTFVDAVRSTGGKNLERVLIISGYNTNIDLTTNKRFLVPQDSAQNKLMVSVHYVDNSMYWQGQIGTEAWVKYIENQCTLLKNAFTSKGIPVFLGETTSQYPITNIVPNDTYKTSSACLEYVLGRLKAYGFVPVLWDTHSKSSFYNREECRIRNEENVRNLID